MASGRMDISLCLASDPISLSTLKKNIAVLRTVDDIFTQPFDEYACKFIFSNDQGLLLFPILKEIEQLFVIYL